MHFLFEPGFFSSTPVQTAIAIGAVAAIVSAVVGTFTVIRSQSFAGHALSDVATTGGSVAAYLGSVHYWGSSAGLFSVGGPWTRSGCKR